MAYKRQLFRNKICIFLTYFGRVTTKVKALK